MRLYYCQESCVNQSFFIERKISLTNMLKCAGPNRGPCSTPDSNNISKELRCYLF